MNILDIQDNLKNFSEKQLINEMQMPSGNAPQFLVLSEITRRKRMRDQLNMQKAANEPTVAQEAVASAGVPAQGIMGMSEAMAPKAAMADGGIGSVMSQPMKSQMPIQMRSGGLMQSVPEFKSGGSTRITERRMKNGKIGLFRGNTFLGTKDESGGIGTLAEKIGFGSKRNVLDSIKEALGFEEGGVIKAQNGLPLGLRQRNPGNIRPGANFIGESGAGGGYATFGSDDEGLRAIQRLLMTYGDKYGINTLRGLANRYAPPSDNNPTGNYIDFLASKTGIDPDAEINLAESGSSIIPAIVGFEQGQQPYTQAQIDRAISAAGTDDPTKVAEIFGQPLLPEGIANQDLSQEPDMLSSLMGAKADDGSATEDDSGLSFKNIAQKYLLGPEGRRLAGIETEADIQARAGARSGEQIGDRQSYREDQYADLITKKSQEYKDYVRRARGSGVKVKSPSEYRAERIDETGEGSIASRKFPFSDLSSQEQVAETTVTAAEDAAAIDPSDDSGGIKSVLDKAVDKADKITEEAKVESDDSSTATEETNNKKTEDKAGGVDPNKPIYSPQAAGAVSSLESEILAMQKRMKKSAEQDKWLSLAQAGLALMSSTNPTLLGALGEAGISGLSAMKEAESRYQEGVVDLINARAKLSKSTTGMDAGNAVTRLGQIERALGGADGMTLSEPERQRLLQERLYLQRFIKIPEYTTGANTTPPAS
tara:strand:- start:344 stop:2470 length:2127 start_codon:yes stop_codon:yes gene_type:complete